MSAKAPQGAAHGPGRQDKPGTGDERAQLTAFAKCQYRSGSIFASSSSLRLAKNGGICMAVPSFS